VRCTAEAFLGERWRRFGPLVLSGAQHNVLHRLAEATAGWASVSSATGCRWTVRIAPGLLELMEKAGWVRRDDPPADRRSGRVGLTNGDRAVWGKATTLDPGVVGPGTAGLGANRMDDSLAALATPRAERHEEGTRPISGAIPTFFELWTLRSPRAPASGRIIPRWRSRPPGKAKSESFGRLISSH